MPNLDCRRDAGSFGEAPGHKGQGSLKPGHPVLCTKLPDEEHTLQAPPGSKFKIHISKQWGSIKCNAGEFEDVFPEKRLLPDGCGSTISSVVVPWTVAGLHSWGHPLCSPVPHQVMCSNKSHHCGRRRGFFRGGVLLHSARHPKLPDSVYHHLISTPPSSWQGRCVPLHLTKGFILVLVNTDGLNRARCAVRPATGKGKTGEPGIPR